ncbi:EF hand family protein [Aphelenchoides avenae]|nr:EF hand family protein [Aphelenchus avenae]
MSQATLPEDSARVDFRNAFITEIDEDLSQKISFRELVDVIVCAGRDISPEQLKAYWPYESLNREVTFEEAFTVFRTIPAVDYLGIAESLRALSVKGELNYDKIIAYVDKQHSHIKLPEDEPGFGKNHLIELLRLWKQQRRGPDDLIRDFERCRNRLCEMNARIVKKREERNALWPLRSSSESLSSVFSNRNVMDTQQESLNSSFREYGEEKVTKKALVIQKSPTLTTSIAYFFVLDRAQRMRIVLRVNDNCNRFQNTVLAYITGHDSNRVIALTKRKDASAVATEWLHLQAGMYAVTVNFCRALKVVEPDKSEVIVDDTKKLTKSFKVMMMNIFDMFDLDNDGLLSRIELDTYTILSGSERIKEEEWKGIVQNYDMRNNSLTMSSFLKMHQAEADSYDNGNLKDMWVALRELGHNRKFYISTACPLFVDFVSSEGAFYVDHFEIDYFTPESSRHLVEYYWENATLIPYLKDMPALRQFKTDYFAVLIAGRTAEPTHYHLDLSTSYNVNIEGNDLIIDQTVEPDTIKVITIAIAQAESWYLSVKKFGHDVSRKASRQSQLALH